jgi:uncharacterized integral membrane protein
VTGARVVAIVLAVFAVVAVGTLFVVQNISRETQLSLDLGFRAWQLRTPVSIPVLIATCFGTGVVVAGLPLLLRSMRLQSKLRRLELTKPPPSGVDAGQSRDVW